MAGRRDYIIHYTYNFFEDVFIPSCEREVKLLV